MKRNSIQLSIPEPCHESWQSMTPDTNGRFCKSCQKTVIDFSIMSDQEIVKVMNNAGDDVCGYFHPDQLDRNINGNKPNRPWASVAAMITALTLTAPAAKAASTASTIQMAPDINTKDQPTDTLPVITGTVTDSANNPIMGASVEMKDYSIYVTTDQMGNFSFPLPQDLHKKELALRVECSGHLIREVIIEVQSDIKHVNIKMESAAKLAAVLYGRGGGVNVVKNVTHPPHLTFWQRMKRKVTGVFHSVLF